MTNKKRGWLGCGLVALFIVLAIISATWLILQIPLTAKDHFGPSRTNLNEVRKLEYSIKLLLDKEEMLKPIEAGNLVPVEFEIESGQSIISIAHNLQQLGLIRNPEIFRIYLIYSGNDSKIQAGRYRFSQSMSPLEIANKLVDATPEDVTFVVLAGWRAEEIAVSLSNSGLGITPEAFLKEVRDPDYTYLINGQVHHGSLEGYLFPGQYEVKRTANLRDLVGAMTERFNENVAPEVAAGFAAHGLSVEQGVILASIVQREAVQPGESPKIASVFVNRVANGMKLDSDATVQYALGQDPVNGKWWKSPLSRADLEVKSAYNTYLNNGFPPGPICNPGRDALLAVANPEVTNYLYFQAKCDQSGYHNFAESFDEHVRNLCP